MRKLNNCTKCDLCISRKNIVQGIGYTDAKIMFINESPSYGGDKYGVQHVGKSDEYLKGFINRYNLDAISYTTSLVKCRTPQSRPPSTRELVACIPHLNEEIQEINPILIVCVGTIVHQLFNTNDMYSSINKARCVLRYNKRCIISIYKPGYVMKLNDDSIYTKDFNFINYVISKLCY